MKLNNIMLMSVDNYSKLIGLIRSKRSLILVVLLLILVLGTSISLALSNRIDDDVLNSEISKEGYYIGEGLENISETISLAVKSYVNQDKNETNKNRENKLRDIYTDDSPVFDNLQNNIRGDITKVSSEISSMIECDTQESSDSYCANIMVNTIFYTDQDSTPVPQTYWLILKKQSQDYKPYNIGVTK